MARPTLRQSKESLRHLGGALEKQAQRAAERLAGSPRVQQAAVQLRDQLDKIIQTQPRDPGAHLDIVEGEVISEETEP